MKLPSLSLLSVVIASYVSFPALAAETPVLDEVVVTAQKRAQKMEDVPISLTALNGAKLEEAGITSISGIADYTPSFNMTQTGIGTNIAIRGISSGVNQGFEQSAAMFVDQLGPNVLILEARDRCLEVDGVGEAVRPDQA